MAFRRPSAGISQALCLTKLPFLGGFPRVEVAGWPSIPPKNGISGQPLRKRCSSFLLAGAERRPLSKRGFLFIWCQRGAHRGRRTCSLRLTLQNLLHQVGAVEGLPLGVGDPAALACVRTFNKNLAGLGSAVGEEITLRRDSNPAALLEGIKDTDRVAGLGVPQPGRTVPRACQHLPPVRTKGYGIDLLRMSFEPPKLPAGLGVPQSGRTVQKHCEHISTIKTKDSRPNQGGISVESFELYLPEDTLEVINRSRSKGCKLAFPVDHVSVCRSILDHQML